MSTTRKRIGRTGWQQHLSQWEASNLTQAEYCRRHDLNPRYFSQWKSKLKAPAFPGAVDTNVLVPVHIDDSVGDKSRPVFVTLPNGVHLTIPSSLPEEQIQRTLHALLSVAC